MNENKNDEISLVELFAIFLKRIKLFFVVLIIFFILAIGYGIHKKIESKHNIKLITITSSFLKSNTTINYSGYMPDYGKDLPSSIIVSENIPYKILSMPKFKKLYAYFEKLKSPLGNNQFISKTQFNINLFTTSFTGILDVTPENLQRYRFLIANVGNSTNLYLTLPIGLLKEGNEFLALVYEKYSSLLVTNREKIYNSSLALLTKKKSGLINANKNFHTTSVLKTYYSSSLEQIFSVKNKLITMESPFIILTNYSIPHIILYKMTNKKTIKKILGIIILGIILGIVLVYFLEFYSLAIDEVRKNKK